MFSKCFQPEIFSKCIKNLSTSCQRNVKVTVCGASGLVGQPLSLLLKQAPIVSKLSLYDNVGQHTMDVATDLSHIASNAKVVCFIGRDRIKDAMDEAEVIIIPASMPHKLLISRNDLFTANACIIQEIIQAAAQIAPKALIGILSNNINSTVPIAAASLKRFGVYDPNKLFGITTLNTLRANTFIAEAKRVDPEKINIPVVGGQSGITIVPLISQSQPTVLFAKHELAELTTKIQRAEAELIKVKIGTGASTLAAAYAGFKFAISLCRAIKGESNIVECAFVESDVTEAKFFSTPLRLGPNGVEKNLGLGKLTDYESELLKAAIIELKRNIQKGEDFCKNRGSIFYF